MSSCTANRIRSFLLRNPKPSKVRLSGDGEPQEIQIGKTSYSKHAETIAALQPSLLECLDATGALLRAVNFEGEESRRSDAAEVPSVIASDPNAAMLTHCANLIHRAYEHSTEIAFTKLCELVERMGDRADAIEQRLERTESVNRRLLQDQVEDAFERAQELADKAAEGGDGGASMEMLRAFLGGAQRSSHGTGPAGNGRTNGAGASTNGKPAPKA